MTFPRIFKPKHNNCLSELQQSDKNILKNKYDYLFIWSLPDHISYNFKKLYQLNKIKIQSIYSEVDHYSDLIIKRSKYFKYIFLTNLIVPTSFRGFGINDLKNDYGIHNILNLINLRLAKNLKNISNVYIFNSNKWIEKSGNNAFDPISWYTVKIPFSNNVLKEASLEIQSAIEFLEGYSKKIIIIDLDDTIWGGIVGDVGWENIRLGGHDSYGEAFKEFQRILLNFKRNGILLAIASKNEEKIALNAIKKNEEMILKQNDFVSWKINWEDKSKNILKIMNDLNLGLDSAVFLDDSKSERERVKSSFPEILVPDLPNDPRLYPNFLNNLQCFNFLDFTWEDQIRSKNYTVEKKRQNLKINIQSEEAWIKNLNIRIIVETLSKKNLNRIYQLFNKTNQMNLSTRRMEKDELYSLHKTKNHKFFIFNIFDKYGDYGLTGISCFKIEKNNVIITDFLLSCRVFNRNIEVAMFYTMIDYAQSLNLKKLKLKYIKTKKNKPCLDFLNKSKLNCSKKNSDYFWNLDKKFTKPNNIKIINKL